MNKKIEDKTKNSNNQKQDKTQIKKQLLKKETLKFKSKYFEYYDDIKISDRQDW